MPGDAPTRTTDIAGITVTESGEGPAILLVHGGSADGSAWARVAGALPSDFRALRYDRYLYRGHEGRTGPVEGGAEAMSREVADLLAIADAVPAPLLLVGHSSGAVVALQAALNRTFAGMVLYEPPVAVIEPIGGDALRRARAALDAGDPDKAIMIHLRDIVRMPAALVALVRIVAPVRRAMGRFAAGQIADDEALESVGVGLSAYERITTPVLLLGGAKSPAHLRQRLAALAAALPTVDSVVIMPRQGHIANVRAPHDVATIIAEFARRILT
jgi:pimeloyl-ACP methyl ester carboxylesterase